MARICDICEKPVSDGFAHQITRSKRLAEHQNLSVMLISRIPGVDICIHCLARAADTALAEALGSLHMPKVLDKTK